MEPNDIVIKDTAKKSEGFLLTCCHCGRTDHAWHFFVRSDVIVCRYCKHESKSDWDRI